MDFEAPRFENGRTLLIAGLAERYNPETAPAGIPAQWQRFAPFMGHIPGQIGKASYGILTNTDSAGNADYICGVEVSDFAAAPPELRRLRIHEQKYAVFSHRGHISAIRDLWHHIRTQWLPASGRKVADSPEFERYGQEYDPATGNGGFEIWIPLRS